MTRLEDQRAERRCQCQCHKTRQRHRNRDSDGELLVHFTDKTAHEGNRNEHGAKHENNRNNRPRHFTHGLDGGLARRQLIGRHDTFDVFQNHDSVVDHDTDCQHQTEQRQEVDGEAEHIHARKSANDRDRHCDDWNERRAPVLQEDEHHQHDENDRLDEGVYHFLDGDLDELRRIERDRVIDTRREARLQLVHTVLNEFHRVERIRARLQIDCNRNCRRTIKITVDEITFRA